MSAPVTEGEVILDKYRVERVLGQGGMGIVVAAKHVDLDQHVALKFLLPEALEHPAIVERFAREARAAAKIESRHVARVIDTGRMPNGVPFMVMEFLDGRDLGDVLDQDGPLEPALAIEYVLQACEAIAEAHAAGIVHRDLKPANLFLATQRDRRAIIKVLDFGISKVDDPKAAPLTQTATMMGSPNYMSPEQLVSTKNVDARSDIWALGVILYELIAGVPPFVGDTMPEIVGNILQNEPVPLMQARADVPPGLTAVVSKCLKSSASDRYANVAELATALEPFVDARAAESIGRISRVLGVASIPPRLLGNATGVLGPSRAEGTAIVAAAAVPTSTGLLFKPASVESTGDSKGPTAAPEEPPKEKSSEGSSTISAVSVAPATASADAAASVPAASRRKLAVGAVVVVTAALAATLGLRRVSGDSVATEPEAARVEAARVAAAPSSPSPSSSPATAQAVTTDEALTPSVSVDASALPTAAASPEASPDAAAPEVQAKPAPSKGSSRSRPHAVTRPEKEKPAPAPQAPTTARPLNMEIK